MAQLKAGSTVGGVALLTSLKPSNLTQGAGTVNQFLGVDANNNVQFLSSFQTQMQGNTTAFSSGGLIYLPAVVRVATIDKFPFATTPITATSAGSLSQGRADTSAHSSPTTGYTAGGENGSGVATIDSFPFTAPFTTATSVGSVSTVRYQQTSHMTYTTAYMAGGFNTNSPTPPFVTNAVESFPFTAPFTTTSSVGTLSAAIYGGFGQSSTTTGYATGNSPVNTTIFSFPFSAPFSGLTNVGTIASINHNQGISSTIRGYATGTNIPGFGVYSFPFAASTPFAATAIGGLSLSRFNAACQASPTEGYTSGGITTPPVTAQSRVDKFPFAASTPFTATNIGALSQARTGVRGQHY